MGTYYQWASYGSQFQHQQDWTLAHNRSVSILQTHRSIAQRYANNAAHNGGGGGIVEVSDWFASFSSQSSRNIWITSEKDQKGLNMTVQAENELIWHNTWSIRCEEEDHWLKTAFKRRNNRSGRAPGKRFLGSLKQPKPYLSSSSISYCAHKGAEFCRRKQRKRREERRRSRR